MGALTGAVFKALNRTSNVKSGATMKRSGAVHAHTIPRTSSLVKVPCYRLHVPEAWLGKASHRSPTSGLSCHSGTAQQSLALFRNPTFTNILRVLVR